MPGLLIPSVMGNGPFIAAMKTLFERSLLQLKKSFYCLKEYKTVALLTEVSGISNIEKCKYLYGKIK